MYEPNPFIVFFERYWTTVPVLFVQVVTFLVGLACIKDLWQVLTAGKRGLKRSPDGSRKQLLKGLAGIVICPVLIFVLSLTYWHIIRLHEYRLTEITRVEVEVLDQNERVRRAYSVTDAAEIGTLLDRLGDNKPYYWRHEGMNDAVSYRLRFYRGEERLPESAIVYPGTDKRPDGGVVYLDRDNWPHPSKKFDNRGVREWIDSVLKEKP